MFALYEGSVKLGFESDTLKELLDKLNFERGEDEFGERAFAGAVDLYDTPESWSRWVEDYHFNDDMEAYDDEEDRERQSAEWLRETGMPRTLDDGALIVYVESPDCSFKYLLFPDGAPDLRAINAAIDEVMPNYGYRIVEEI